MFVVVCFDLLFGAGFGPSCQPATAWFVPVRRGECVLSFESGFGPRANPHFPCSERHVLPRCAALPFQSDALAPLRNETKRPLVSSQKFRWVVLSATRASNVRLLGLTALRTVPYVTQWRFRAGNLASGQDFGRILVGKASKFGGQF